MRLSGTTASPQGTIGVDIAGLRMRSGAARGSGGESACHCGPRWSCSEAHARLDAGPRAQLTLSGTAPLSASERINLRAALARSILPWRIR